MGKVGILTSRTKWINEEVTIMADGKIIIVGVVEYTDDWSPFRPLPFDKVEEESDEDEIDVDEDDEEVERVLNTWMGEYHNSEKEDGEFWPEDNSVDPPVMNYVAEEPPMVETKRDRSRTPNSTPMKVHLVDSKNEGAINDPIAIGGTYIIVETIEIPDNRPGMSVQEEDTGGTMSINHWDEVKKTQAQPTESGSVVNPLRPIQNLVPLRCFGSFPNSSKTPFLATTKGHELETENKSNNARIRKRKQIKSATKSPPSTTPSTRIINSCLSQLEHMAHTNSSYASTKPIEMSVSGMLEPNEAKRTV